MKVPCWPVPSFVKSMVSVSVGVPVLGSLIKMPESGKRPCVRRGSLVGDCARDRRLSHGDTPVEQLVIKTNIDKLRANLCLFANIRESELIRDKLSKSCS